jgi:DNA-binding transcriptional LysR family regulator
MNLDSVRAFVAVAESHEFRAAGLRLGISQQAASKRVASLEHELHRRLFARSPRGALLTLDGQALLPRARELLRAEARALAAVRPERRPLRVDVINARSGPAHLLRDFHDAHSDVALEVLMLLDASSAIDAVGTGAIDATFRAAPLPGRALPRGIESVRVLDEALLLLVGREHPLADRRSVRPAELAQHPVWMPSLVEGTEWTAYYAELSRALGARIDTSGPNFGSEEMLKTIAASSTLATFMGAHTRPAGLSTVDGLKSIPLRDPIPVYPHSLLWHAHNLHPALAMLREHVDANGARGTGIPQRRLSASVTWRWPSDS